MFLFLVAATHHETAALPFSGKLHGLVIFQKSEYYQIFEPFLTNFLDLLA